MRVARLRRLASAGAATALLAACTPSPCSPPNEVSRPVQPDRAAPPEAPAAPPAPLAPPFPAPTTPWLGEVWQEDGFAFALMPTDLSEGAFASAQERPDCPGAAVGARRTCRGLGPRPTELETVATIGRNGEPCLARAVSAEDLLLRDTYEGGEDLRPVRAFRIEGCDEALFTVHLADEVVAAPPVDRMGRAPAAAARVVRRMAPGCAPRGVEVPGLGALLTCTGESGDAWESVLVFPDGCARSFIEAHAFVRVGDTWHIAHALFDAAAIEPVHALAVDDRSCPRGGHKRPE